MLGSSSSSSLVLKNNKSSHGHGHGHDDGDQEAPPPPHPPLIPDLMIPQPPIISMRRLLISCAELISQSDFPAAHRILSFLCSSSSSSSYPYGGDSTERLVHQFTKALSLRITRLLRPRNIFPNSHHLQQQLPPPFLLRPNNDPSSTLPGSSSSSPSSNNSNNQHQIQSCYLSLNQITPFIRFSHLTANQAILEAAALGQHNNNNNNKHNNVIHILDFDIMHGVQWPPLMQALAERSNPPMLRITGTGHDLNLLHRTGHRLSIFAQSLGLRFQFHPLLLLNDHPVESITNQIIHQLVVHHEEDAVLAVNCVMYLHRLLKDDCRDLRLFLHKIKSLNPVVVTVAETEANHNHPLFLQRFVEALDHYSAIFESLEATVPPNSQERVAVEQIWFGKEIVDIVAAQGDNRRERHERLETWELMLRSSGFCNVPLSSYALSQAKLLLRLHYPSEGYQLQIVNDSSFFLGWRNRSLFSVSSWR